MAGSLTDGLETSILDHIFRNTTYTPDAAVHVALCTTIPTDAAAGTEVTGGAYARQPFGAAAAASGSIANNATITFPTATANWGTVVAFEIWSAVTAGTRRAWGELLSSRKVITADPATDIIASTAHGLVDGTSVEVEVVDGTLPTGLADNTEYFVRDSLTNSFKLAATLGGVAIDITGAGSGAQYVFTRFKKTVNTGDTAKFSASQLVITMD